MTVSTLANRVVYQGNGATTQFAVPFKVLDEDHLVVQRRVYATGEIDDTYIGTEYSYSGIGDDSGTLTLDGAALEAEYELVIERIVPYTQELDLVNAGGFYPETVEEQLDLIVMGMQQIANDVEELDDATENAAAAAQAVIDAAVFTVTSASGQTVGTRTLLAGIAAPVNNQSATLTEEGREGRFLFSTANNAANVTADPDQGIYVPPTADTTGATGAWVRDVEGLDYYLTWFYGTVLPVNTSAVALRAINLLPAGATLHLGVANFPQTTSLSAVHDDFCLKGQGPELTRLVMDVGSGAIGNFGVVGSNITVEGIGFETNSDHVAANNNPNVGVGAPNGVAAPLCENLRFINCRFTGGGIGLIISGSDDNDETITLAKNIFVDRCIFENDTMGLSFAGCEDVIATNCLYKMIASAANGASCCVRVWGSKNVRISGHSGNATGEFGVFVTTFNRTTAGPNDIRLVNEDLYFNDCHFTNCTFAGLYITECIGDFIMDNCSFKANTDGTTANNGIMLYAGFSTISGVLPSLYNFEISNTKFIGYSVGLKEQMACRKVTLRDVEVIGNDNADAFPDSKMCGVFAGGVSLFEALNCNFLMKNQSAGANFRIVTGAATTRMRILNCSLPEGAPASIIQDVTGLMGEKITTGSIHYSSGTFAQFIA